MGEGHPHSEWTFLPQLKHSESALPQAHWRLVTPWTLQSRQADNEIDDQAEAATALFSFFLLMTRNMSNEEKKKRQEVGTGEVAC